MPTDPVEWSRILMNVSEKSQKLIQDYLMRIRDKPIDMMSFSPAPIMESMAQLTARFLEDPDAYTEAQLAMWQHYIDLTRTTIKRMQGQQPTPTVTETAIANDKRFKAKEWQTNPAFDFLRQFYLSTADETRRLVHQETAHIEDKTAKKIEFYTRLFLDATAPNNFWLTNPEVLRATVESQGENLVKGLGNLLEDLESGNGMLRIRMSDYNAFEIGKNIATTPGKVVYQNELMQLIQYAPSTPQTHRVPLLIMPPWINKYYILDLREKNSFIHYLVAQGYTVFCISWVNPTKRLALTQFQDYMDKGALTAMREIRRITGEDTINMLGYCIGGTLLACAQAYLAGLPAYPADLPKIVSATYLVTMIDFSDPGDLGVFIDEDQVRMLEDRMAKQGFMDAASMALTFNLLRANDLIWPFVINNYLLGREPFPFDILYWNGDSTNLPATMQSYYLRKMYMENRLIEPNALKMKNVPLDLGKITTPTFMLSTREDHIAPWRSTYAATHIYNGPVTFVLAGSGHIAGVVNPPDAKKYDYWTNDTCPADPDEWFKNAKEHKGSWWPEWIKWLGQYAGEKIAARQVGTGIEDAPGSYVKVRAV
ncbi:MAG: class I poly(R)-hydroxyalkanoic acid synthase [Alphaproteobacteria bacterium]